MISLLRVMATMGILAIHVHQMIAMPGIWGQIASYGADGVKFYYFATGYLGMNSWQKRKSTKAYWEKRIERFFPLYYFLFGILLVFKWDWLIEDKWAIPRTLFMVSYFAPPTGTIDHCAMYLLGHATIFMFFYAMIPVVAKFTYTLDQAFFAFWIVVGGSLTLFEIYGWVYGAVWPGDTLEYMRAYFCETLPYFGAGVLVYFGKRGGERLKLMMYMICIASIGYRYTFLKIDAMGILCLIFTLLLVFPINICPTAKFWKSIRWIDKTFGMGVYLGQTFCFRALEHLDFSFHIPTSIMLVLMLLVPYFVAFVLHYFIENPGAKLVRCLFAQQDTKNV